MSFFVLRLPSRTRNLTLSDLGDHANHHASSADDRIAEMVAYRGINLIVVVTHWSLFPDPRLDFAIHKCPKGLQIGRGGT